MPNVKRKIRHALDEFAEGSTMHGFKEIKDSPHIIYTALWILAVCGSVVLLAYQTKMLLDAYLEEKTAVSINTMSIDEEKFQTIVYCSDDWIDLK